MGKWWCGTVRGPLFLVARVAIEQGWTGWNIIEVNMQSWTWTCVSGSTALPCVI